MLKMIIAKLLKNKNFILSAGMSRSGSTLLYNILRICLQEQYGNDFKAGWIDDIKKPYLKKNYLIKTHSLDWKLNFAANKVFYSYRDIRACLVSQFIKFKTPISYDTCKKQIEQYQYAKKSGAVMISYESLIQDKEAVIEVINQVFNNSFRLENIIDKLPKIEISRIPASHYNPETLLHNEHGTGITRSDWSKYLNPALQSKIEKEFEWWFNEVGYEV